MDREPDSPFAVFPVVEEDEATGRVAAVFARVLEQCPFVPSLFKSLAVCPPYLVLAWEQAAPALAGSDLPEAARRLAGSVAYSAAPPDDRDSRELLAGFVDPLGRMLLLSCGLLAVLRGELSEGRPAEAPQLPPPEGALRRSVPSARELDAAPVFGRIRATLDTPIVNSIWRRLADEGRLEAVWHHLEPQASAARSDADRLQREAMTQARELGWEPVADRAALRASGVEDALPGMAVMLEAYVKTLPRVLALVASCDTG